MVCSTCGFENQVGNRFCGMCGTPLPHRPLTSPGAQSTASLTRALSENGRPGERKASATPVAPASLEVELRNGDDQPTLEENSSRDMVRETTDAKMPTPQFDLVPEMPLEEYVQKFRYVPPIEPDEVTMRGEAAVLDSEAPAPVNTVPVAPVEIVTAASAVATPRRSDDDVRERLGLEVTGTAEERSDRPRFLDFNEPSAAAKPMELEAPVAGPAFLGRSDASAGATTDATDVDVEEPSRGRWRIWMATAAVLVFGALAALEWRAQVRQTNNGPIEVIRMKMRGLGRPPKNAGNQSSSPGAASDSTSRPVMQAEPPSEAQKQDSSVSGATGAPTTADSAPNSNAATTPPAGSAAGPPASAGTQPAGGTTSTPEGNAAQNSAQAKAGQTTPAATTATTQPAADKPKLTASQPPETGAAAPAKPKPSPKTADSDEEVTVKKTIPGGEEVAKANNASDSAAEAAWLWKATAKGNPDAPVRLADMYVKGDGVPRSCEQAMVLLKTAATKENALARNRMASLYSSGTCVQRNRVEAYRWLSSALVANPNSEWARQNRETLWRQMTPEERTLAQKYR